MHDTYWLSQFRERMTAFGSVSSDDLMPVSVKIRVSGGCFHRSCSPEAYRLIDEYVQDHLAGPDVRIEEHETGPEILAYVVSAATLSTAVINLVAAIIKARSEGIKKGDRPKEELEVIIRGFDSSGGYFEEKVIRISSSEKIDAPKLIAAIEKSSPGLPAPKSGKKGKKKGG